MLSVRIPEEMNKKLDEFTQKIGVSKAQYILTLIAEKLGPAATSGA